MKKEKIIKMTESELHGKLGEKWHKGYCAGKEDWYVRGKEESKKEALANLNNQQRLANIELVKQAAFLQENITRLVMAINDSNKY